MVDTVKIVRVKEKMDLWLAVKEVATRFHFDIIPRNYWYGSHKLRLSINRGNNYWTLESTIPESIQNREVLEDLMFDEFSSQIESLNARLERANVQ